ncbi:MAG TPA: lipocalin family protein [Chloroflexota bacterium]|nr:lipocalin family protein [Chloroflexota bacterium]
MELVVSGRSAMKRRALAALPLAAVGCARRAENPLLDEAPLVVRPAPTPTTTALPPVRFPQDEGPHDVLAEWWYYTGHLRDDVGDEYGFELVFFRGVRGDRPPGYAAHFAVTDLARRRFAYDQRQDVALREPAKPASTARMPGVVAVTSVGGGFDLQLGGWTMRGLNGRDSLRAEMPSYTLDAQLTARKPPALHLGFPPIFPGLISFGPAGASYYYSRTKMDVGGTLTVDGRPRSISGSAWMDHQWGDFLVLGGGGWDWFAVSLDDDRELTLSVIRDERGQTVVQYGTLVTAGGEALHVPPGSIALAATGTWRSPRTGVTYPAGWRIVVQEQDLDVTLIPVLADQELDTRASTGVIYWEGAVEVRDARDRAVGKGYVELTGYK